EFGIKPKFSFFAKPAFSALVMFFIAFNLKSMLLIIPVSIVVYSLVLFLVRGITKEDLDFIRRIGST
ncbi:MAG: hypothetical protein NZ872_06725, partial [Archaeoglobaceae archaeon]|nr:hypothetical protein [Archaeoglobaceae archaeon]MDW8128892.1 hypothetical protein [Archaeoglobaceae archaeon]